LKRLGFDAGKQGTTLSTRRDARVHPLVRGHPLSHRHLEEMMEERGVSVDHSSINRWAIRFLPVRAKAFRCQKLPVGTS